MRTFKLILGESLRAASPVRLFLVDDFTGRPPFGALNPALEELTPAGPVPASVRPRVGSSGALVYPNLGLVARPGPRPLAYRLTLTPDFYVPYYCRHLDELGFEVAPFTHAAPPAGQVPAAALKPPATADDARFLLPNVRYPFEASVTVLYGRVIRKRQQGQPAAPAEFVRVRGRLDPGGPAAGAARAAAVAAADVPVRYGVRQVALTDAGGWFALPLRTAFPEVILDVSSERPGGPAFEHKVRWANRTTYLTREADWIELPV